MKVEKTPIIPIKQTFAKVNAPHELHLEAICVFAAIGFFLDEDTYWKDLKVMRPASTHTLDEHGFLKGSEPWFEWHYAPRAISFENALDEYSHLFETIITEQTQGKKVILPLSGGLDSRTQAAALNALHSDVFTYSYEFEGGFPETQIGKQIATSCGFEFQDYKIGSGYLWPVVENLSEINGCYSDFTSPRQMAIANHFKHMGDVFSLGHWGDVLFDSMGLPDYLPHDEQVSVLITKLLKRGGVDFAEALWKLWDLEGTFIDYFRSRLDGLLKTIAIADANAKLRAFKSKYWAPRWTSVNLSIFNEHRPISLPYYDDRMCQFICSIPEAFLKHRQLQIAYIKRRAPELAKIPWQDHRPFNLNTYHFNKVPFNLPYKVFDKLKRELKAVFGKPYIQRNWELQFLGKTNKTQLEAFVLHANNHAFIPNAFIKKYCDLFYQEDCLQHAHALNMLLVLTQFNKKEKPFG